jgi:2-iminobutanoate/2-iminopropanoate deaminase
MNKTTLFFLSALVASPCLADTPPPFSNILRVGDIVYVSGQLGTEKPGTPPLVPGGIAVETKYAMENIKQLLSMNALSMDHIFKCTIAMTDMKEWAEMNKVYTSYFEAGHYPVRMVFGASQLALGAKVEISCDASVNSF